jgi:Icc protein
MELSQAGLLYVIAADLDPVRIIDLDITVPGSHHGNFDDAAADWLELVLADEPDRPTMIAMHQPFTTGIAYMDRYGCRRVSGSPSWCGATRRRNS